MPKVTVTTRNGDQMTRTVSDAEAKRLERDIERESSNVAVVEVR